MNKQAPEQVLDQLETHLVQVAHDFAYPATPNIGTGVRQRLAGRSPQSGRPARRLAWTVLVAALAMLILLAMPPVRTTVLTALQQGLVRIFLLEPLATSTPLVTITPAASAESTSIRPQSFLATPRPPATPISARQNTAGQITTPVETPLQVSRPARPPTRPPILKPPEKALKF